jgi:hypothetical protein
MTSLISLGGYVVQGGGALPLGPTTATISSSATPGTLIAAITGLATGEEISTVVPNDGRLALDGTRRNLLVGLSAIAAGTIAATLTTSAGRTLAMDVVIEGAPAINVSSGSSRARINTLQSSVAASTTYVCARTYHDNVVPNATLLGVDFWNGYASNGGGSNPENPSGSLVGVATYRAAIVTNIVGSGLNQTGATLTKLTFFEMLNDAAFVAAGGSVSSDGFSITVPANYVFSSDPNDALTLPVGGYFIHTEDFRANASQRPIFTRAVSAIGDAIRSSSAQNENVNTLNWTSGALSIAAIAGPIGVRVKAPAGVKTVVIDGDSIIAENADRIGLRGTVAFGARALLAAGYPFFNVSIPGSGMGDMINNPANYNVRRRYHPYADAVLTNHGNNDRGNSGAATLIGKIQSHGTFMRSLMTKTNGLKRLVRVTLFPHTTSTDNFQTTANQSFVQSDDAVPGTQGTVNDWLMRRNDYAGMPFVPANGDPDAAFDAYAAVGGTADGKWPVTGWAGGTLSATFASGATSISIAAASPPAVGDTLRIQSTGSNFGMVIDSVSGSGPYTVNLNTATPTTSSSNAVGDAVTSYFTPDGTHAALAKQVAAAAALRPVLPALLGFDPAAA